MDNSLLNRHITQVISMLLLRHHILLNGLCDFWDKLSTMLYCVISLKNVLDWKRYHLLMNLYEPGLDWDCLETAYRLWRLWNIKMVI